MKAFALPFNRDSDHFLSRDKQAFTGLNCGSSRSIE